MKIVIAGAGGVGTHLAELLSKENQDIVLIDENPEKLANIANSFDLMTLNVNPTSIKGLREAGTNTADLFIAVTPDETKNMTCCMLASAMGAQKTVARIDNDEYLMPQHSEFFQKMGINSMIYPELLAAEEIAEALKRSWVRQWWEVHNGALIMLGIKLRETAEILNIPLKELSGSGIQYHIVAIKRGEETIIPNGDDELRYGDFAYFMCTKKFIPYIRKIVGKEHYEDVRNVMIMGGGMISIHTAKFAPSYMNVKIIEQDAAQCVELNAQLEANDALVIHGDARDAALLQDEGVEHTQAFVALTDQTEINILACLTAKRMGVRKTVALIENMDYIGMAEKLDIGTIINKKAIAASHIYQLMLNADVADVKCLTLANADVAEFVVKDQAKVTKKQVKDLGLPHGVTIGGLVRDGDGMLVSGNTQILPGDCVVVFCKSMLMKKIEKYF